MKLSSSLIALASLAAGASAFAPRTAAPLTSTSKVSKFSPTSLRQVGPVADPDDENRSERASLDITQTVYTSAMKTPKDAYIAFAEKGAANCKLSKKKILHQSILGGCYVGFGGLLSLSIAGNIGGVAAANPGIAKFVFAALFPVNLLLIVTTSGQLFTGNSATVAAAKFEKLVTWRELVRNWIVSIVGNVIGCSIFALAASYTGLLSGGTGALAKSMAMTKCGAAWGPTLVKAIMCNWMVSMAVFLAGASNDLAGKLVGCWFPISTFVGIGLEHSIANMFVLPAAILAGAPLSLAAIINKNLIPVLIGNAIAGALIVAGSYSYQFGILGGKHRAIFEAKLKEYEQRKIIEGQIRSKADVNGAAKDAVTA